MTTARRVSVIVPVLGDGIALRRLLHVLRQAAEPPAEIIVVDGAADARVSALCAGAGVRYAAAAPGRGPQLRAGAALARGEIFWFLHADAEPAAGAMAALQAAVAAGAVGGCFRFRFAGAPGWHKRALAALVNLRARCGVPYGDQGLFATRTAYFAAGGFAAEPLFEEVPLVRGLRRRGRFAHLALPILVSPRRWEQQGWLRRSLANRLLAMAYMAGIPAGTLARHYRPMQESPEKPC